MIVMVTIIIITTTAIFTYRNTGFLAGSVTAGFQPDQNNPFSLKIDTDINCASVSSFEASVTHSLILPGFFAFDNVHIPLGGHRTARCGHVDIVDLPRYIATPRVWSKEHCCDNVSLPGFRPEVTVPP